MDNLKRYLVQAAVQDLRFKTKVRSVYMEIIALNPYSAREKATYNLKQPYVITNVTEIK